MTGGYSSSRHGAGMHNLKMMYDELIERLGQPTIGFPRRDKALAQKMTPEKRVFIYITSPIQRIIGLARPSGVMVDLGSGRWPLQVPVVWEIGPCDGVTLHEAQLSHVIYPTKGDSNFILADDESVRLAGLLGQKSKWVI